MFVKNNGINKVSKKHLAKKLYKTKLLNWLQYKLQKYIFILNPKNSVIPCIIELQEDKMEIIE